jgi:hypothetical protein
VAATVVVLVVEIDAGALTPEELDIGSREGMEEGRCAQGRQRPACSRSMDTAPYGHVLEDDRCAGQWTRVRRRCGRRSSATREPLGPCSFAIASCRRLLPAGLLGACRSGERSREEG